MIGPRVDMEDVVCNGNMILVAQAIPEDGIAVVVVEW